MKLTEAPVLPPLPPQEYAQLRESIRERGVLQPLLITADHVLIDGHERWKAIQELGLSKYFYSGRKSWQFAIASLC
jgi:ParB-like chromosome segregation protein Spo0J